jgi:hypothetical protein
MVALTNAVDQGTLLMEHIYPADPQAVPLMKNTLLPGLEIKFERTHDLSAVIHAERLKDGRMLITAVPLLYGSYTTAKGVGTFSLDPPLTLNLQGGWPLYKEQARLKAELRYADYRRSSTAPAGQVPVAGVTQATPAPAVDALVRVEHAKPVEIVQASPPPLKGAATPAGKRGKLAKGKATPGPTAASSPAVAAAPKAAPSATPIEVASAATPTRSAVAVASPPPAGAPVATPITTANLAVSPAPNATGDTSLASTAGGGSWKTFAPGKMPLGRLITPSELKDIADRGIGGERIYLKGQFVVNFSDTNKAVLRPRTRLASAMLHLGKESTRIIVEFPAGYSPPAQGSVVSRDEARPLEITEVRRQEDGQLNVFAREIMQ